MPYPEYEELEQPLLKLLFEKGGATYRMRSSDTYRPLADYFGLSEVERTQTRRAVLGDDRDEPYWNNMVQWARRKLNDRGYLADSSRGFWQLSSKGVKAAETVSTGQFSHVVYPDELLEPTVEGAKKTVSVNIYERSADARQKCIDHYGYDCSVCDRNLESIYGERGRHLIHVHHVVPISSIGESYVVDPIKDLRPICPNCHAVIHRTVPPCTVDELRKIVKKI